MAHTLQDLYENSDLFKDLDAGTRCDGGCGKKIPFVKGRRSTANGVMCDDCYFGELGEFIEQYPNW